MNSLARTFSGKTTHYSPDGCGRDWYILHNNGGVYRKPCVTGFSNEKSPVKHEYSPPQPRMQAKYIKYSSDGTGRDAYINVNSGGLHYPYGSRPFYTTLRTWSPIKTHDSNDLYFKTQQIWLKRRARKNSMQEETTSRLSAPKKREENSSPTSKPVATTKRITYPRQKYY